MKRVYKSPATPERLRSYVKAFPDETWEHFRRRNRRGYREVKQQLLRDQHGLCAYCEISIKLAEFEDNVDDFRVEHFFPKVATEFEKHNYHLDWHNLLGVCHGGSQPYVSDPEWRYSSRKNDRSCDVPKGGKPISERILNPLKIPASVSSPVATGLVRQRPASRCCRKCCIAGSSSMRMRSPLGCLRSILKGWPYRREDL